MFITFEGLDLAGKTTQIDLLQSHLAKSGKTVRVLREPGGTNIGEKIRTLLLDRGHLVMTDLSEVFLFSASRAQLVREVILPALERGEVVVCDRFYDSTTAYQGWGRGIPIDAIHTINRTATGGLKPDATFFLDISLEEMESRRIAAGKGKDRMESNTREFYERVRNGYLDIARTESRFVVLDGLLPENKLHSQIWERVYQIELNEKE
jgi:dTMP kinase